MPHQDSATARDSRGSTSDRAQEEAVRATFPASDPVSSGTVAGTRAVPAETLLPDNTMPAPEPADAVMLAQAFPEAEAAKLALEALVREGPLDRRCAEIIRGADERAELSLCVPREDAPRLSALMQREAGLPAAAP